MHTTAAVDWWRQRRPLRWQLWWQQAGCICRQRLQWVCCCTCVAVAGIGKTGSATGMSYLAEQSTTYLWPLVPVVNPLLYNAWDSLHVTSSRDIWHGIKVKNSGFISKDSTNPASLNTERSSHWCVNGEMHAEIDSTKTPRFAACTQPHFWELK